MSLKPSLEHVELRMENYTYLLAILGQEFFVGWPYISSNISWSVDFSHRDFNFSARESVAILGIHSVIKHQSVREAVKKAVRLTAWGKSK